MLNTSPPVLGHLSKIIVDLFIEIWQNVFIKKKKTIYLGNGVAIVYDGKTVKRIFV
jgi:hypothetical protein